MLDSLPFILILGTLLGFLSGIGVGGGSLLVLWLTVVMNMPPETTRTVNLLFFLPVAVITVCFRRRQGILNLRPLIPAIVSGCISAAACSLIAAELNTGLLKKCFGVLLILTGFRELFYKNKKAS